MTDGYAFNWLKDNIMLRAIETRQAQLQRQQLEENSGTEPQLESIQAKLTVGAPGDKYEQEADMIANQVMSMSDTAVQRASEEVQTKPFANGITPLVQRVAMPEMGGTQNIQRQADESNHEAMLDEATNIIQKALNILANQIQGEGNTNGKPITDAKQKEQDLQTALTELQALKSSGKKDEIISATQPIIAAAKGDATPAKIGEQPSQQESEDASVGTIQRNTIAIGGAGAGAGILTGLGVITIPAWVVPAAIVVGVIGVGGYIYMSSKGTPGNNQAQNKQFKDAVREIERRINRKLSKDEIRRLHNAISGQNYDYHGIVAEGVGMFGN